MVLSLLCDVIYVVEGMEIVLVLSVKIEILYQPCALGHSSVLELGDEGGPELSVAQGR